MQKEIYLIRHGETEYNKSGRVQGSGIDAPLNMTGKRQAQAFYECYKHVGFDKIYISTLIRTAQSIAPFTRLGIEVEKHEGLNEINWGVFEGTTFTTSSNRYYSDMMTAWQGGDTHLHIQGGESPECVAERQKPFLDLLLEREDEKKVLICMHGRAMRILLCQLTGTPLHEMDRFEHTNFALYHLAINSSSEVKLLRENCTAHLRSN